MASQTPYGRLTGTWKFWAAPSTEAIPDLDAAPAGNWVELGATEGDQAFTFTGALTGFSDNEATGNRKHVRPEEGLGVTATLVNVTLEMMAKSLGMAAADVVGGVSGALTTKKLKLRRGHTPTRYSLLARGGATPASNHMSPYGAWPAQLWVPMGVFDGEPALTFSKGGSPGVAFEFLAEYDDNQAAGEEFGYLIVQSA